MLVNSGCGNTTKTAISETFAQSIIHVIDLMANTKTYTSEKQYRCQMCWKSFASQCLVKIHLRTHTGEKTCICPVCNKGFKQLRSLKIHRRTHTGEKTYTCPICKKGFATLGSLKIHRRTHTGEKPYTCSICKKGFTTPGKLKIHRRTHTGEKPYTCQICNKVFARLGNLKTHGRTHTGENPYICPICNKGFTQIGNLNTHRRTHTGEKPYTCPICNKGFTRLVNLMIHRRTCGTENQTNSGTKSHTKMNDSVKQLKLHGGEQPESLTMRSEPNADQSHFLTCCMASDIGELRERLSMNICQDSSEFACPLPRAQERQCLFIGKLKSHLDVEASWSKSFGCGICDELFELEDEMLDHCSCHRLCQPVQLFDDLC